MLLSTGFYGEKLYNLWLNNIIMYLAVGVVLGKDSYCCLMITTSAKYYAYSDYKTDTQQTLNTIWGQGTP